MAIINIPRKPGEWFIFAVRLLIGVFFIWASLDKIVHPEAFAKVIHNYRMLPPAFINIMAIFVPWLELVAGLALIIGYKYKGANIMIAAMLIVFIIALTSAYSRGLNINCGCFSTSSSAKSNLFVRIIEDVLMLIGCLVIMFDYKITRRRYKTELKTV